MENFKDATYRYAKVALEDFKIKRLGDYHDLYVQSDKLLQVDVFVFTSYIVYLGFIFLVCKFKKGKKNLKKKEKQKVKEFNGDLTKTFENAYHFYDDGDSNKLFLVLRKGFYA